MVARQSKVPAKLLWQQEKAWVKRRFIRRRHYGVQDKPSRLPPWEVQSVMLGWEKLTTDKSVVHIVSDAVIGEPASDALADTAENVRGLTDKAGEAVGTLSGAVAGIDSKLDGVSNFLRQATSGGGMNMLGNFVRNLGHGNVSGLSIAGLVAAAFLIFGRFGWLGKIAGAFLGMMLIGNNAGVFRDTNTESVARTARPRNRPIMEE